MKPARHMSQPDYWVRVGSQFYFVEPCRTPAYGAPVLLSESGPESARIMAYHSDIPCHQVIGCVTLTGNTRTLH